MKEKDWLAQNLDNVSICGASNIKIQLGILVQYKADISSNVTCFPQDILVAENNNRSLGEEALDKIVKIVCMYLVLLLTCIRTSVNNVVRVSSDPAQWLIQGYCLGQKYTVLLKSSNLLSWQLNCHTLVKFLKTVLVGLEENRTIVVHILYDCKIKLLPYCVMWSVGGWNRFHAITSIQSTDPSEF